MKKEAPIGVIDSGQGGVSILLEIRRALPGEALVYIADSAHVPYGGHAAEFIVERTLTLGGHLAANGAKALVVACNTATAAALPALTSLVDVPVVGVEPAVKPAAAATRCGVVGVLATIGTLKSARFAALLERFGDGITVVTEPCPGLVEQVEKADFDGPATRAAVRRHLAPLKAAGADVVILGCTHYPFLRPVIEDEAGDGITVIDTGRAVARQVARRLGACDLLANRLEPGEARFLTTGDVAAFDAFLGVVWPGGGRASALDL